MSDILIEDKIVMRPINTVKPYIRNPRKNDKTVELLCRIIPKVGFNVPLVIDENGIIIKGHARFTAAIRLGMTEVPCIISHADEEAIKADRITDNKISEFSEWVNEELLQEIEDLDFDLSDLGLLKPSLIDVPTSEEIKKEFDMPAISEEQKKKLYEEFEREQAEAEDDIDNTPYYKCVCEKCGHIMFIMEDEIE